MEFVKDLRWKKNISAHDLVKQFEANGFQSIELYKASRIALTMIREKAKIFFTYTSNLITSGLRGLIAQWIENGLIHAIVTTTGGIEEDIMRAIGEKFIISSFYANDHNLHEKGMNRIGNLIITNDSYARFEGFITPILREIAEQKKRLTPSELIWEIGKRLNDEHSILYQAYKHKVPIFVPGITDGALGFHLYLTQQKYKDFVIDVVKDFANIMFSISHDDKKGLIALGGGISKHHAILASLISGGLDYAIYITTETQFSGSMSGATTNEAKSWGKVKDDSDSITVYGDATILFPLLTAYIFDEIFS